MRPKLQYMSTGTAVVDLQTKLNLLMPVAFPPLKVDGKFGDKTLARVKQFQGTRGLAADGIVGAKTWAAIDGQTPPGAPQPKAGPPAPANPPGWDQTFPLVHNGAMMFCTHGTEPRGIKVNPPNRPASVADDKPGINIPPFGGCLSWDNPAVVERNMELAEAQGPLAPPYASWEPAKKKKLGMAAIPAACGP